MSEDTFSQDVFSRVSVFLSWVQSIRTFEKCFCLLARQVGCTFGSCRLIEHVPRRGGSNKYLKSMFLSRNKKNNVYPCKPQFYYIKVGFKGVKII